MGIIRLLDDHVANQIAAGEVVERPSSVVKELVENAVDAGSTRIDIEVEEGGLQLIRVVDNGAGMAPDDCELAFQRHATSKIATGKDLFQIRTLGFRGEALPSIAAVAKVECVTSAADSGLGSRITIEGGTIKAFAETASRRGTDIAVRELFYNTPARLKYMKTIQTELGHISDYVYRLALAHPDIAFSLKHNGSTLVQTLGNGDLLQVIASIYGTSAAKQMVAVEGESLDYAVSGFVSKPELTRANRQGITAVVNGRYIRSYGLAQALLQAYHTLLPINRFPLAVLHVRMDPSLLDVNVHPAKLEARFSKEGELMQTVEQAVKRALGRQAYIPQGSKSAAGGAKQAVVQEKLELYRPLPQEPPLGRAGEPLPSPESDLQSPEHPPAPNRPDRARTAAEAAPEGQTAPGRESRPAAFGGGSGGETGAPARFNGGGNRRQPPLAAGDGRSAAWAPPAPASSRSGVLPLRGGGAPAAQGGAKLPPADKLLAALECSGADDAPKLPPLPRLDPVGQVHGTYIVAQNEDGLFLIDQHAAHERINYEHYYELFGRPAEASQELLVPISLDFTPDEAELLKTRLAVLEQSGVYIEPFGGTSFLVRAYPHWMPQGEEREIIEEMIEWVLAEKKTIDLSKLREKWSTLCSCKASVKANQSLSRVEMEALIDRLAACRIPYTCPHGRPIIVSFSKYELEKMFKRVM